MYNFHKSRDTKNRECFRHENFVRGKKHLLALIAKKKKKRDQDRGAAANISANVSPAVQNPMSMGGLARMYGGIP